ncbi:hypothetical protein Lal_00021723 [Lupinus albus]|nr:hypothetical protein Lal_00021723 [Lupinus albus]
MARKVNFIEEINSTKDAWKIKVRVIGLWRVDRSSAPSLEMIFMDENGDKIEAVVKNYHISQWEPQLQEGQSYVDVIGEFIDIEMSQPESMSKKVVFGMRDQRSSLSAKTHEGITLVVHCGQLLKYERDHKFGPIVVVLTLAKIREAKGGYPIPFKIQCMVQSFF